MSTALSTCTICCNAFLGDISPVKVVRIQSVGSSWKSSAVARVKDGLKTIQKRSEITRTFFVFFCVQNLLRQTTMSAKIYQ